MDFKNNIRKNGPGYSCWSERKHWPILVSEVTNQNDFVNESNKITAQKTLVEHGFVKGKDFDIESDRGCWKIDHLIINPDNMEVMTLAQYIYDSIKEYLIYDDDHFYQLESDYINDDIEEGRV